MSKNCINNINQKLPKNLEGWFSSLVLTPKRLEKLMKIYDACEAHAKHKGQKNADYLLSEIYFCGIGRTLKETEGLIRVLAEQNQ